MQRLGASSCFVYNDPTKATSKGPNVPDVITWQFVQNELAEGKGLTSNAKSALHINAGASFHRCKGSTQSRPCLRT